MIATATETGIPTLGANVTIKGELELRARLNRVAPQANKILNHGLTEISRAFYKRFAAERLSGPPGITVSRVGRSRTKMGVPPKARLLGFFSRIIPVRHLLGKKLKMWAGWPEILIHETGGTISAKGGGWLYLRKKPRSGGLKEKGDITGRVRRVTLKPRLQFIQTFEENAPEYRHLLDATWQKLSDRV